MPVNDALMLIAAAAFVGILATVLVLAGRERQAASKSESPFAASSEGLMFCPSCGGLTESGDVSCAHCGARLPEPRPLG